MVYDCQTICDLLVVSISCGTKRKVVNVNTLRYVNCVYSLLADQNYLDQMVFLVSYKNYDILMRTITSVRIIQFYISCTPI